MNCDLTNVCCRVLPPLIPGKWKWLGLQSVGQAKSPLAWLVLVQNFSRLVIAQSGPGGSMTRVIQKNWEVLSTKIVVAIWHFSNNLTSGDTRWHYMTFDPWFVGSLSVPGGQEFTFYFLIFQKLRQFFLIVPHFFSHFLPHFGPLGGRLGPERPWYATVWHEQSITVKLIRFSSFKFGSHS